MDDKDSDSKQWEKWEMQKVAFVAKAADVRGRLLRVNSA